jgi:hypothetical protein
MNIDGRASPAMRDALLAIWRYAHAGGKVRLLAYDVKRSPGKERDQASAEYLSRERAKGNNRAYWIVFGGNVHARKIKGLPIARHEDHEPPGYQIRDWSLIHLDVNYHGVPAGAALAPTRRRTARSFSWAPPAPPIAPHIQSSA